MKGLDSYSVLPGEKVVVNGPLHRRYVDVIIHVQTDYRRYG